MYDPFQEPHVIALVDKIKRETTPEMLADMKIYLARIQPPVYEDILWAVHLMLEPILVTEMGREYDEEQYAVESLITAWLVETLNLPHF